jgi:phage/plasmid-like protein (TIGR03299 family)
MHALEIGSAGQVAFATREVPAWHLLGTVFDKDEAVTTQQMLTKAYLDKWNVRLVDLSEATDLGSWVTESHAVVRDNPFTPGTTDVLSVVGGRYKVVQNEELFSFGDTLLDGGGQWETAGSIKGGRQVFGSLKIDREVIIDPNGAADGVDTYLLVNTSHDGSVGVQASTTPVRVVCQNTLNYALKHGLKQTYKMRHTQTIEGRIAAAREALNLTHAHIDAFEAEAAALYAKKVSNADFLSIVTNLYPKPEADKKGAFTRWENKVALLGDLFAGVETVEGAPITNANITGTAWGALNALTERLDWYRTARDNDPTALAEAASGFSPVVNAEKARIHSAVKAFAFA